MKNVYVSFYLFHATTLEFYRNFSFAMQLYSVFMLLNDAALSTHKWYFRSGRGMLSVATLDR